MVATFVTDQLVGKVEVEMQAAVDRQLIRKAPPRSVQVEGKWEAIMEVSVWGGRLLCQALFFTFRTRQYTK